MKLTARRDSHDLQSATSRGVVSIFSANSKEGRWELPRHMRVLAVFGTATVDLREALILPGISEIEVMALVGNIEIIVPPELNIECNGDALLGTFTIHRAKRGRASFAASQDAPLIRVTGDAYVASVTVDVKEPRRLR